MYNTTHDVNCTECGLICFVGCLDILWPLCQWLIIRFKIMTGYACWFGSRVFEIFPVVWVFIPRIWKYSPHAFDPRKRIFTKYANDGIHAIKKTRVIRGNVYPVKPLSLKSSHLVSIDYDLVDQKLSSPFMIYELSSTIAKHRKIRTWITWIVCTILRMM